MKTLTHKSTVLILWFISVLFVISSAQAVEIYSTFGPGYSCNYGTGWSIGSSSGETWLTAAPVLFSPELSGYYSLDSIVFAAFALVDSAGGSLTVSLASDNGSYLPGTILESATVSNIGYHPAAYTASFSSTTIMDVLETYWVILSATNTTDLFGWSQNNRGLNALAFWSSATPFWQYRDYNTPAFAVNGTQQVSSVPEPASILLLGAGLLGVGVIHKRFTK